MLLLLLLQSRDGLPLAVQLAVVLGLVAVDEAEVPPLFTHHRLPLIWLHQGCHLGLRFTPMIPIHRQLFTGID